MSFGLSAIASVSLFILPGFVYLQAEARRRNPPLTFSINRELFVAVLISIAFHVILITTIELFPFLPDVHFREVYCALSGAGNYVPGERFAHSVPYFAAYLVALYGGCFMVGSFAARGIWGHRLELLPAPTGPERYLAAGEDGVWCVVDIVTVSDRLYRGVYHSTSPKGDNCPAASINLILASRWSGKAKSPVNAQGTADVALPGFRDIRAWVAIDELRDMIRMAFGADEDVRRDVEFLVKYEGTMEDFLIDLRDGLPEFYVFWNDIKNINVRQFELNSDDQPTDEELARQFPEAIGGVTTRSS